jgi:hypothetical protein
MMRSPARNRARLLAGCVTLLLIFPTPGARAANSALTLEELTCEVTGQVVDQSGAAIEGARVALADAADVEMRRAGSDPQTLDFAGARYTRAGLSFLNTLSLSFSYNGQRDDRTSQSINNSAGLRSRITDEFNRADVFGYPAQATAAAGCHTLALAVSDACPGTERRVSDRRRNRNPLPIQGEARRPCAYPPHQP